MAKFINPSPSAGFLANLFGIGVTPNRGGFKLNPKATKRGEFPYASPIFGPAASGDISSFLNLTGPNTYTAALRRIGESGDFSQLPAEFAAPYATATSTLDELIAKGRPLVSALIETGLPVDISSVVNAAQSRYRNDILPTAAEMYNPAQGTAFQNIAAREAQLLADELGQLDYSAQEAARARQVQGLTVGAPALAGLSTARIALPGATTGELAGLSQLTDPGGRLLSALLSLLGQGAAQPSELVRTGSGRYGAGGAGGGSSGTGEALGGIGSLVGVLGGLVGGAGGSGAGALGALGALCWVADELFGPFDIRALLARAWCFANPHHPFVERYREHGREWAATIRAHPELRPVVAPAWEWMAAQGAAAL